MNKREIAASLANADPLTLMHFVETADGVIVIDAQGRKFRYTYAQLLAEHERQQAATQDPTRSRGRAKDVDRSSEPKSDQSDKSVDSPKPKHFTRKWPTDD